MDMVSLDSQMGSYYHRVERVLERRRRIEYPWTVGGGLVQWQTLVDVDAGLVRGNLRWLVIS
jgi:hypothetical protein